MTDATRTRTATAPPTRRCWAAHAWPTALMGCAPGRYSRDTGGAITERAGSGRGGGGGGGGGAAAARRGEMVAGGDVGGDATARTRIPTTPSVTRWARRSPTDPPLRRNTRSNAEAK